MSSLENDVYMFYKHARPRYVFTFQIPVWLMFKLSPLGYNEHIKAMIRIVLDTTSCYTQNVAYSHTTL